MVIFYKKWKKYNEFQLTKNKMDLNIRKMTNHPPSPVFTCNGFSIILYLAVVQNTAHTLPIALSDLLSQNNRLFLTFIILFFSDPLILTCFTFHPNIIIPQSLIHLQLVKNFPPLLVIPQLSFAENFHTTHFSRLMSYDSLFSPFTCYTAALLCR